MKKVGIVTFHTALNYGAVMQTYALQHFLLNLNIDNEIINYICPFIEKCYSPFFISDGKIFHSMIRGLVFGRTIAKKKRAFRKFTSVKLRMSKEYKDSCAIEKDADDYSYFISGSDQVWSPISAGFDETYFLPFAKDEQKISYAASIGVSVLSGQQILKFKKRLNGFSVLSVREETAKKLFQQLNEERKIYVHVDPTLLLDKECWDELLCELPVEIPKKYLLIFNVEKPICNIEYAKRIAKEKHLKIVYINDRTIKKDKEIIYVEAPSPDMFLTLFANAKVIVTNSFHGTVFSIIFQKDFCVELKNKKQRNIRAEGLLKELQIDKREIQNVDTVINTEINWRNVESILSKKRLEAASYLKSVLKQRN